MSIIRLSNQIHTPIVSIPKSFFTNYMPHANGEYVKIFLFLYMAMSAPSDHDSIMSISLLADTFHFTENDILRACNYWKDEGLLDLLYESGELVNITFLPMEKTKAPSESSVVKPPLREAAPVLVRNLPASFSDDLADDENYTLLAHVTEKYIGTPLSSAFHNDFKHLYHLFDKDSSILEYIVEYAVERKKTSIGYIKSVAHDCHAQNLHDLASIKYYLESKNSTIITVLRSFGIINRTATTNEREIIRVWTQDWNMPEDLIAYACEKTIAADKGPSFSYADGILKKWHEQGIHTLEDAKKSDEAFRAANSKNYSSKKTKSATTKKSTYVNRFNQFEQHDYDFDEIDALLEADIHNTK